MKLTDIINKSNKWMFCDLKISRFLIFNPDLTIFKKKYFINLGIIVILLLSMIILFIFYLRQYLYILNNNKILQKYIILKIDEGHNDKNIFKILNIKEKELIKINAFNKYDYMKIQRVGLIKLFKKYITNLEEFYKLFHYKFPKNLRSLIFRNCIKNLALFSYYCAFFDECKKKNEDIVVLTTGAWFPSNAAICEGLRTYYFVHGHLQKVSPITLPLFDYIYVYSFEEKKYYEDLKINSRIFIYPYDKTIFHKNTVIFFMRQGDHNMDEELIINLLKVFQKYNYKIYFKNHPIVHFGPSSMAYKLSKLFDIKIIESTAYDGYTIIREKQPRFIVSWSSTAICESLNCGVIPITLTDPSEIHNINPFEPSQDVKFIYPFFKRSIAWPSESQMVHDVLNLKVRYMSVVKKLQSR